MKVDPPPMAEDAVAAAITEAVFAAATATLSTRSAADLVAFSRGRSAVLSLILRRALATLSARHETADKAAAEAIKALRVRVNTLEKLHDKEVH